MLKIKIGSKELYDELKNEFFQFKDQELQLEHSLVSISKWESTWHKPFLSKTYKKTNAEELDYIRCMTTTQNVDPIVYKLLTPDIIAKIGEYIQDSMTATTFTKQEAPPSREVVTSELIYYWMVSFNIPFECQRWHLNRLITLINICSIKNTPKKKKTAKQLAAERSALNEARKAEYKTNG